MSFKGVTSLHFTYREHQAGAIGNADMSHRLRRWLRRADRCCVSQLLKAVESALPHANKSCCEREGLRHVARDNWGGDTMRRGGRRETTTTWGGLHNERGGGSEVGAPGKPVNRGNLTQQRPKSRRLSPQDSTGSARDAELLRLGAAAGI